MRNNFEFYKYLDSHSQVLDKRYFSFKKIFEYLDSKKDPITIVETGCTRQKNNWTGDGQSTILFDKYIESRCENSFVISMDLDIKAVNHSKSLVGNKTQILHGDSVALLHNIRREFVDKEILLNCLYLDSYDVDWDYWFPSAAHHLKELVAISPMLQKETLVVVDDCGIRLHGFRGRHTKFDAIPSKLLKHVDIGGKGKLVADYANAVGAKSLFADYQAGWIEFV